jgi:glycosyltransferase involved in cell wall biosynthesis
MSVPRISVLIPALNERESIGRVLSDLPGDLLEEVVVVDNGSTDGTGEIAAAHGARVIREERRGYGRACLTGLDALKETDVVVFLDADYSDDPTELPFVVAPILENRAAMVIGSRVLGERERGALLPQARFGNFLSVYLIRTLCGETFTDLGPFRAIRKDALDRIGMVDEDFGWTVEMQVKAARAGLRSVEVPVRYRCRIGRSKISGTVMGSIRAGEKILRTIWRYHRWRPARRS